MSGVAGRSGGKKTPTAILLKRGAWRGKVRKGTEPEVMLDRFVVPANLSKEVQAYYNANLSDFKARGILSDTDSIAFEMLAKAFARWRAVDALLRNGDNEIARMFGKVVDKFGNEHLAITDMASEEKERFRILKDMLIQFGFTPVTRANVNKTDVRNIKTNKVT
jgi:phage terminase small subunit